MRTLGTCLVMICVVLGASIAFAQDPRGGADNGGFGGRGRRGGGGPGGFSRPSPDDMLKMLDTNGNGMLDEDEINNSPAKAMIERILGRMGIPLKYPIPISDISTAMQNMRNNRSNNGPPGGGRGQRFSRNAQPGSIAATIPSNNNPNNPSNNAPSGLSTAPNGSTGFGEAAGMQPTSLGFGEGAGVAGSTTSDPALDQKIRALADTIIRKYDKNNDGRLDSSEWPSQGKWGAFSEANRSGGSSIGAPELVAYLTDLSRRQTLSFDVPDSGSPDAAKPRPKRFLTARERLPSGLPDWFLRAADDDGQITMSGYAANFPPEDVVAQFSKYDLNQDGIITAAECLKVEKTQGGQR